MPLRQKRRSAPHYDPYQSYVGRYTYTYTHAYLKPWGRRPSKVSSIYSACLLALLACVLRTSKRRGLACLLALTRNSALIAGGIGEV